MAHPTLFHLHFDTPDVDGAADHLADAGIPGEGPWVESFDPATDGTTRTIECRELLGGRDESR